MDRIWDMQMQGRACFIWLVSVGAQQYSDVMLSSDTGEVYGAGCSGLSNWTRG